MIGPDPAQSLLYIPGHKAGIPVSGADESVVLLCAEIERLRGILSETERVIAGLVGIIGMDYDPELHPADTLRLFEQALCFRLDNPY